MSVSLSRGSALLSSLLVVVAACGTATAPSGRSSTAAPGASTQSAGVSPAPSAPRRGGTLRVARSESFDGWDPDAAAAYATYQTLYAVLEPLVRFTSDGQGLEPGLAESWTYDPDSTSWTFKLREGATFSDGSPLTADDVVFSADQWKQGANLGAVYAGISAVEAPDPQTVVFKLAGPDTTLPVILSWSAAAIFPKDFGGRTKEDYFASPIGAGAFTVAEWTPGGQIVLKRSEHYYLPDRPYLDEIVVDVVADANERALLFEAGQADISEYVSAVTAARYGDALIALPSSQIEHLSLNLKKAPLDDVNVRLAIAHGIDFEAITGGPFKGYGSPPRGIVAPNLPNWAPPSLPLFTRDIAEAQRLLAASKHPDPGPLELVYDSGIASDALVAQIVEANLAEIGIDATLSGLETGAFLDRAFGLDADMVLWSYGAISPDAIDPLGWFLATSWLFTGQETDTLFEQFLAYSAADTSAAKQAIITRIQDQALENAQAISLSEFQVLQATGPKVNGFASAPWGLYYWDPIWLDD